MRPPDSPENPRSPEEPPSAGAGRSLQTQIGGTAGEGQKLCPKCEARYPIDANVCPIDGTPLVEVDETIGTTLSGTYFVRRALGEGAMGKVYEARHTRIPAKRFAVKMLHPEYVFEPQVLARFAREAEAAATIDHPNVVAVIDVDRTPHGVPFLVSEFLEGKDFAHHLDEAGKMPVAAAVRVVRQIADALSAAHARGIIHRDVKPENVFLTGDPAAPTAKVLDFGISRLERRGGKALTEAGAVLGTPEFMPPEQARGDRVDHRADVYAVGALLYTALTGKRPFERETPAATLLAVLAEEPAAPRALEPSIPEALELVILRAMARDPERRYATMEELSRALAKFDESAAPPRQSRVPSIRGMMQTLPDDAEDRLIAHARPALAAVVAAGFGVGAAMLVAALAALVRAMHGDAEVLSGGEAAVVILLVLLALGPPLFLAVRALRAGIWQSPLRAANVVRVAGPPVACAVAVYGIGSAAVRGIETTLLAHPTRPPSGWDVVLLLLGLAGAGLPAAVRWADKRAR
jgi:serine/threonine-protein kinase